MSGIERCINLSAAEARARADGATCLIRPATPVRTRSSIVHVVNGMEYGTWGVGDVLIGREAWDIADINEQTVTIRYWCGGDGWVREWPTPKGWRPLLANHEWTRSAATMPAALARHRMRVVSVRVCRWQDVTTRERRATRMRDFGYLRAGADTFVSVTMLEPA